MADKRNRYEINICLIFYQGPVSGGAETGSVASISSGSLSSGTLHSGTTDGPDESFPTHSEPQGLAHSTVSLSSKSISESFSCG